MSTGKRGPGIGQAAKVSASGRPSDPDRSRSSMTAAFSCIGTTGVADARGGRGPR